ncbi:MAG: hypothetical protein VYA34_11905 [Myxococcota bacterium]|nr:hypothetical protein [Myxococcota bacterium]
MSEPVSGVDVVGQTSEVSDTQVRQQIFDDLKPGEINYSEKGGEIEAICKGDGKTSPTQFTAKSIEFMASQDDAFKEFISNPTAAHFSAQQAIQTNPNNKKLQLTGQDANQPLPPDQEFSVKSDGLKKALSALKMMAPKKADGTIDWQAAGNSLGAGATGSTNKFTKAGSTGSRGQGLPIGID